MDTFSWVFWILCGLLVLVIILGKTGARLRPRGSNKLKPTLAAELAQSRKDIEEIVGPSDSPEGPSNRSVLRWQQYLDLPFIVVYTLLFFVLGQFESTLPFLGASILGLASRGTAVIAAVADLLDDLAILRAVRGKEGSVRRFGVPKWLFFFLTLIGQSFLFFYFPAPDSLQHGLAFAIGFLFLLAGLGGVAAILLRRYSWIRWTIPVFGGGLVLLLVLSYLHRG